MASSLCGHARPGPTRPTGLLSIAGVGACTSLISSTGPRTRGPIRPPRSRARHPAVVIVVVPMATATRTGAASWRATARGRRTRQRTANRARHLTIKKKGKNKSSSPSPLPPDAGPRADGNRSGRKKGQARVRPASSTEFCREDARRSTPESRFRRTEWRIFHCFRPFASRLVC